MASKRAIADETLKYHQKSKEFHKNRSCTDLYCLIIFLSFVIGWGGVGLYAYLKGDVDRLLAPTDSEGRKCGLDEDVTGRPYLVFFDLTKCVNASVLGSRCETPQVCVESCPANNFVWTVNSTLLINDLETLRASMMCKLQVNLISSTYGEMATYVSNDVCARWYLNSSSWIGRCIPNGVPDSFVNLTLTLKELAEASEIVELLVRIEETVTNAYDDFLVTRWLVLAILGCSVLVSLIYIVLLHWIASSVVHVSIVAASALLLYSTYQFFVFYADAHSAWWLAFGVASGILLVIVLLVCIFLRKRILLACKLIGESSRAVINSTSSLFFPLVPVVFQIMTLGYALVVAVYVLTLRVQNYTVQLGGDCMCDEAVGYANGTTCSPQIFAASCREDNSTCISGGCYFSSTSTPWFAYCMHIFNVFGLFWVISFISAFGEMVLAGTFATWYWTMKKSDVPFFTLPGSVQRTVRYHLGTLAFGSLLIAICTFIRSALEIWKSSLKKWSNVVTRFLLNCTSCCFSILEKFFNFINKNAYIVCAISGKGFYPSAREALALIMRNIARVIVLDKVTEFLLFVGKSLITIGMVWGSWWYITEEYTGINYWPVPVALVGVGTFLITSVFFGVYSMAIETIFHCFLEDSESNDGTPEKPYYMSQRLKKILSKA